MAERPKQIEVKWEDLFGAISGLTTEKVNRVSIEREVVPLVFVPGIMGSRLKNAGTGQKAWDPDDLKFMFRELGIFKSNPLERKRLLVGDRFSATRLEVHDDDGVHNQRFKDVRGAVERGWGGVVWRSYGAFLIALQNMPWSEPIRHCFELPVHAVGYNWTASNDLNGSMLRLTIDEIIKSYKNIGRKCEKVIVITHSMGGLVARSACQLHSATPSVLAVIHGVQPSLGSAAAYWRMKAGFERPGKTSGGFWDWFKSPLKMMAHKGGVVSSWLLGKDGEEVTALLANMPGGLQLLPTKDYLDNDGNKAWLNYPDLDGSDQALPRGDPYAEIYREKMKFYRLVEPNWLELGEKRHRRSPGPWRYFEVYLREAEVFHEQLGKGKHDTTTQFYSVGIPTADRIDFMRQPHTWTSKAKRMMGIAVADLPTKPLSTGAFSLVKVARGAPAVSESMAVTTPLGMVVTSAVKDSDWYVNRGGYRVEVDCLDEVVTDERRSGAGQDGHGSGDDAMDEGTYLMTLMPPQGSGDGTVPESSGKALETDPSLEIDDEHEVFFDRGHEPIYKTRAAQRIVFAQIENYCLERIRGRS